LSSSEKTPFSATKTFPFSLREPAPGTLYAGRYEVIEELGRGGMGKVYKVLDKEIQEEVALKLLNPEIASDEKTIERFRNELKFARRITHRNVCRMHDINKEKETYFITMEYVPGEDLKTVIKRTGRLPEDEAMPIAAQVCEGLTEAHRLGVVHRDLKPQNIMIDRDGNVRIMDFGIARSLAAKGVTEAGVIIGTPDYMSPEQVEGMEADARSDIYALGATLYEMVTGRVPFEGDTALIIAMKHKAEIPLSPKEINPQLSEELTTVILKCLEKDREKRYQTAEELLAELRCVEGGLPTAAGALKPKIPAFLIEGAEEAPVKRSVFVAREQELRKLAQKLEAALSGKGQVAFLLGEAGSGKTALVQEFARRVQETYPELIVASGKCNAHAGIGDPYLPFMEILSLLTGDVESKWTAGVISREHALRLWNLLPLSVKALLDDGQDLINLFVPGAALAFRSEAFSSRMTYWLAGLKKLVDRKSSLPADLMLQQSNLLEQYTRVLQDLAKEKPLLLILDDLQWVDPGSASLLFHLGRRIQGNRILILGAFRPAEVALGRGEERHPLEPILHELKRDFGEIEIEVGKTEARQFVDDFIDTEPNRLGHKFRETLYSQTKGHPLFTVELLRNMEERGALVRDQDGRWTEGSELDWNTLPARVDAVIEERVQRLNKKLREILTIASVEGEEFTAEVVARIQKEEVRELIKLLSRELDKRHHLVSAKGIRQLEKQRLSSYLFQHILFQKYLYNSLDKVERAQLHEEVGNILEALYGEQAEEIAVQLARHFLEAGIASKAVDYFHKAGNKAVRLSAGEEAIAHYKKALELLKKLPETPQRDQQELTLQLALAVPLMSTKGFGAPELGQAVVRARELCDRAGDMLQRFFALFQLVNYYGTTGQYSTSLKFAEQMSQIAEQSKDPMLEASCCYAHTWPLLNMGDLVQTVEYGKRMMDVYNQEKQGFLAYLIGYDVGVFNQGIGSWAQWILGYPDQALRQLNEAVNIARKLGHRHTLAFVLLLDCELNWFLGNFPQIDKDTEELVPFCEKNGFIYIGAHGYFYRGEKAVLEGKVKEGIAQMRQSLAIMEATGTLTCFSRLRARVAEACRKAGDVEEGLSAVDWALEAVQKYDERYMEAELYRLKGELLRMRGEPENEVEKYFRQAIELSRLRSAKSWELRATMSLSRLLQKQGHRENARKMLADVYGWFTEGFETPDLKEAKSLLDGLSAG
jgi:tetratricopeptide (TPR) repeat protein/energy-coupling factor transporter ATP-binding protein EcfA2